MKTIRARYTESSGLVNPFLNNRSNMNAKGKFRLQLFLFFPFGFIVFAIYGLAYGLAEWCIMIRDAWA